MPVFSGEFWKNDFTAVGELPMPVASAVFETTLPQIDDAWAIWACDSFGNDTDTPAIWERSDSDLDLTPGDGVTAATFPTFTDDTDGVGHYEFDGVDDYVSDWPTMPSEYTVLAAKSSSYPDGQPELQSCNDTTIETLLTTPGSYTGNLHSLVIFDRELLAIEVAYCEQVMLKRLWRDTYVNPYTARLIRDGEDIQEYVFTVQASPYTDYSDTGTTPTPTGITWDYGLTFDNSSSVVTVSDEAALRSDEISVFASGNFAGGGGHIVDKGTNYEFSASFGAGAVTMTFNGVSSAAISVSVLRSVGLVCEDGGYPKFYVNGKLVETATSTVTVDDTDTNDLLIGNQSGGGNEFSDVLKRLSICNKFLTDAEMFILHLFAMADFE